MNIFIEVIGWIASVLIVGAYYFNLRGTWKAQSLPYILCNMVGGAFFVANTWWHQAYPSAIVNIIWVLIAVASLFRLKKPVPTQSTV